MQDMLPDRAGPLSALVEGERRRPVPSL